MACGLLTSSRFEVAAWKLSLAEKRSNVVEVTYDKIYTNDH